MTKTEAIAAYPQGDGEAMYAAVEMLKTTRGKPGYRDAVRIHRVYANAIRAKNGRRVYPMIGDIGPNPPIRNTRPDTRSPGSDSGNVRGVGGIIYGHSCSRRHALSVTSKTLG